MTADRYRLVREEPTEEMWTAGREPIMARDCIRDNWSAGDHVREAFGAPPAWMRADEMDLRHVSKGMAAVWTFRAMLSASGPVGEDVVEMVARIICCEGGDFPGGRLTCECGIRRDDCEWFNHSGTARAIVARFGPTKETDHA